MSRFFLITVVSLLGFNVGCEKSLEQERMDVRDEQREAQEEVQEEVNDVQEEREEGAQEIREEQRDVNERTP